MTLVKGCLLSLLALVGLVLGYAWADVQFKGALVPWRHAGSPGEPIASINGIKTPGKLLVTTASGSLYTLEYFQNEVDAVYKQVWQAEADSTLDQTPAVRYYGAEFVKKAPPFRAVQLYEHVYIFNIEGKGEIKFAVDPQGDLWVWNHHISGMTGLVYYYYPVIGLFFGTAAALVTAVGLWLRERKSSAA